MTAVTASHLYFISVAEVIGKLKASATASCGLAIARRRTNYAPVVTGKVSGTL
jgi:hypothetical protein